VDGLSERLDESGPHHNVTPQNLDSSAQASTNATCKFAESYIAFSVTLQPASELGVETNPLITRYKCQTWKVDPSILDRTHNHFRLAADPHLRAHIGQMLTKGAE
jgi:hypothetical protein